MNEAKQVASSMDDDGLDRVTPINPEYKWPFQKCKHKGWHECKQSGWHEEYPTWRLDRNKLVLSESLSEENRADCCKNPTDLHNHYMRAWTAQRCGELDKAVASYRMVLEEKPVGPDDYMLLAFTCLDLGLLLSSRPCLRPSQCPHSERHLTRDNFMKNEREAAQLFKKGAIAFQLPTCIYLYGHVLVYGTGGVKKDIPRGISLLNEAGIQYIGQSFFELGSIYEHGVTDGTYKVETDLSAASDYYRSAEQAYTFRKDQDRGWLPKIETVQRYLRSEGWHNMERASSADLGERLYWAIAGQAFLFGAAASLAQSIRSDHYAPLIVLLPLIGMFLAFFSFSQIHEARLRNMKQREHINSMIRAKIAAYEAILDASKVDLLFLKKGEGHSLQADQDKRRAATLKDEQEKFEKHTRRIRRLVWLRRCSERVLCVVSLLFLVAWLILFVNELMLSGCRLWWNSCDVQGEKSNWTVACCQNP